MIKQVILDMENQLLQVKTQVAVAMADQHLLRKKQQEQEDSAAEWMRKAELAVDKEQDDLARAALAALPELYQARGRLRPSGSRPASAGRHAPQRARQTRAETERGARQVRPVDRPAPSSPGARSGQRRAAGDR